MKNSLVFLIFLILALLTQSCKKDPSLGQQFWDCNASQHFDSTKLADNLIGSWQLTESVSEKNSKRIDKNINVAFAKTGTFIVTENSIVITQGNWRLKIVDSNIFGLLMDGPSEYLYGRILLCDNQVLFNNSYIDGSDNLFRRIN